MKSLITRTITAVFFVVALVGCMIWSEYSFTLFFALVAGMGVWEFSANVNRHAGASVNALISTAGAIALVFAVSQCSSSTPNYASFLPFVGTLLYILISELYRRESNPLKNWGFAFAAQLYIALPLSLLSFLAYRYNAELQYVYYDWFLPLSIFFFLWSSDSGAYLVGSALSRYFPAKLFPRISPGKSWVGSIGGGALTLIVAAVLWHFRPELLNLPQWLGLGLVVCVFGTWGDLVESLFKRQLGIKDSGHLLPGHGGILDRFDSALLAIPAAVIYLSFVAPMLQ